jgi:bifunctional ADP-heptose synthase (sugar kinase/adenylyltransferase)
VRKQPQVQILEPAQLTAEIDQLKQAGKQVVLTAGRFDALDNSQIAMLRRALTLGDLLVVVVYAEPPDGQRRAEYIATLKGVVDYLTVLPEEGLVPLLQRLQPAYYALLGDYTERDLPAAEAVVASDGFVVVLPSAD